MTTYTKAQAKAHDAIVAAQSGMLTIAQDRVDGLRHDVHRAAGDRTGRRPGSRVVTWLLTITEATEQARRIAAGNPPAELPEIVAGRRITAKRAGEAIQALALAEEKRDAERAEVKRLEQIRHDNGNWPRFFLVSGGHIHADRSCHTLRITTRLGWLPDLSGETEETAVAAHGPLLCSVCFPSAPVEWTIGTQAEVDPDQCDGGYSRDANFRRMSPRGTCPSCAQNVSVTSTGKTRKHKRAS